MTRHIKYCDNCGDTGKTVNNLASNSQEFDAGRCSDTGKKGKEHVEAILDNSTLCKKCDQIYDGQPPAKPRWM